MNESQIRACIEAAFAGDSVSVTGDGRHFVARVVSAQFNGLSRLARHRLVYAALGDHMREDIHALSIQAISAEQEHNE